MDPANGSTNRQLFTKHEELLRRISTSDDASQGDILALFNAYDDEVETASLGVYLLVRRPYLFLLRRPLRTWMRRLGEFPYTGWDLRLQFTRLFNDDINYTSDSAKNALGGVPDFHELMLRALLMITGFDGARHWQEVAKGQMPGGEQSIANVILQHLREGAVSDIRLLLSGPEDGFDGGPLIAAVTSTTIRGVGGVCASRAPELFLYRHWRLGLSTQAREEFCRRVLFDSNYWLTTQQQNELVRGEAFLPPRARAAFASEWGIEVPSQI